MKKSAHTRSIIRAAVFGLLALTIPMACKRTNLDDKPAAAVEASQLAKDMIGAWVHVGQPGSVREVPAEGGRFKFRTGRHWNLTQADPATGLVIEQFGGTYTLNGNEYVETQEYADATWLKDNGKSFKFTVKVQGDTMTQIGIGNPYTEVWKRAK
ncbi:MAG: hypothetical protein DME26_16275 [Verrucomicrobia bacterium]|nr:MAG: hypothetical protein DME26_16275 [Verrucomicrobiota bacterium]